jgi:hypothetical protein
VHRVQLTVECCASLTHAATQLTQLTVVGHAACVTMRDAWRRRKAQTAASLAFCIVAPSTTVGVWVQVQHVPSRPPIYIYKQEISGRTYARIIYTYLRGAGAVCYL